MRVAVVGGGPAGLYAATLIKRRDPAADVRVFERGRADRTFGFGVVFSDRALAFLARDDPATHDLIAAGLESWRDITLDIEGTQIRIDGIGFAAIGRMALLGILQRQARATGVAIRYGVTVDSIAGSGDADLVVVADGVNSRLRSERAGTFGTTIEHLSNRFAWYGTDRPFDTLTQTFRRAEAGVLTAHHYRYSATMSTFIVETDAATWERGGFERMSEDERRALCEHVFADSLDGHRLISNRSRWRRFPKVRNRRWRDGRTVLLGDAQRTAHFSIGSGTRLALEDGIALDRALADHPGDIEGGLAAFEAARRPIVETLVAAADASGAWYERLAEHMRLAPWEFAHAYVTRSGRIAEDKLAAMAPAFIAAWRAATR